MARWVELRAVIVRRLSQAIPLLLGVVVVNFLIIHLAPGDPVQVLIGDMPAPAEYVEALRTQFGLDKPLHVQLLLYFKEVLQGNLGFSFFYRQPVTTIIADRLPATIYLMLSAYIVSAVVGVLIGVISASRPYSLQDNLVSLFSLLLYSVPVFWLGQMLLMLLSIKLDLFPTSGMSSLREGYSGSRHALDVAYHLVLPVIALASRSIALIGRLTRSSMLEVMGEDYIVTARAKGLRHRQVLLRHGLRNALLPVVTVLGLDFGFMLAGSVLVETVFGWPGIGRLMFDSIFARDYPMLMGILLMVSVMVVVSNLLTDMVYMLLDPRIRHK